jgi:xanthine dehydrogenase FAD-binding subunit
MYDIKAIYEAKSVQNAIALLKAHPEAKIIAGGSDILIQIREGKLAGVELVSIFKLDELRGIEMTSEGDIRIKPLTSFSHITQDPIIQNYINVLGEAVDQVGGPQIRNIGTIGGNTCNGVTSADSASTLHAWDAEMELTCEHGVRVLPIREFYKGPGKVALKPAELLTAIIIKKASYEGYVGNYIKYSMRRAMDIATLGCSVNIKLSGNKKMLEDIRIAFGVAGPVPMRSPSAENAGRSKEISMELIEQVGKAALSDVNPRSSWRATKEFRLQLVEELTKRALKKSIELAGGVI